MRLELFLIAIHRKSIGSHRCHLSYGKVYGLVYWNFIIFTKDQLILLFLPAPLLIQTLSSSSVALDPTKFSACAPLEYRHRARFYGFHQILLKTFSRTNVSTRLDSFVIKINNGKKFCVHFMLYSINFYSMR